MSDNCKWDSSKHNGQSCPTHSGGKKYSKGQEVNFKGKKYKIGGFYKDQKLQDEDEFADSGFNSEWRGIQLLDENGRGFDINANQLDEFDDDYDEEFDSLSDMLMTNEDDPVVTKGSKVDAKVKEYLDKNWDSIDTNKSVGELAYKISGMIGKPYPQVLDSLQRELPNRLKEDDFDEEKLLDSVDEDVIRDSLKQGVDPKYHKMIDSFDKESMKQGILGNNFDDDFDEEINSARNIIKDELEDFSPEEALKEMDSDGIENDIATYMKRLNMKGNPKEVLRLIREILKNRGK